jgi:hypothetical protein
MGTPSSDAANTMPHSLAENWGRLARNDGNKAMHANANGNKTILATGISERAIFPKRNPVPQRQPAVARARMGMKRPRSLSIIFDCKIAMH